MIASELKVMTRVTEDDKCLLLAGLRKLGEVVSLVDNSASLAI